jgi:FG-GAP-like repeat
MYDRQKNPHLRQGPIGWLFRPSLIPRISKLDLTVANSFDNTVSILLGSGNGNFDTTFTLPTGPWPMRLFLGDVNGDGKLDVVVRETR